jgi:hypothetical protein
MAVLLLIFKKKVKFDMVAQPASESKTTTQRKLTTLSRYNICQHFSCVFLILIFFKKKILYFHPSVLPHFSIPLFFSHFFKIPPFQLKDIGIFPLYISGREEYILQLYLGKFNYSFGSKLFIFLILLRYIFFMHLDIYIYIYLCLYT